MDRQPTRITPKPSEEGKIVTFRDGPFLVPGHLAKFAEKESFPEVLYDDWIATANLEQEREFIGKAITGLRTGTLVRQR